MIDRVGIHEKEKNLLVLFRLFTPPCICVASLELKLLVKLL